MRFHLLSFGFKFQFLYFLFSFSNLLFFFKFQFLGFLFSFSNLLFLFKFQFLGFSQKSFTFKLQFTGFPLSLVCSGFLKLGFLLPFSNEHLKFIATKAQIICNLNPLPVITSGHLALSGIYLYF